MCLAELQWGIHTMKTLQKSAVYRNNIKACLLPLESYHCLDRNSPGTKFIILWCHTNNTITWHCLHQLFYPIKVTSPHFFSWGLAEKFRFGIFFYWLGRDALKRKPNPTSSLARKNQPYGFTTNIKSPQKFGIFWKPYISGII